MPPRRIVHGSVCVTAEGHAVRTKNRSAGVTKADCGFRPSAGSSLDVARDDPELVEGSGRPEALEGRISDCGLLSVDRSVKSRASRPLPSRWPSGVRLPDGPSGTV